MEMGKDEDGADCLEELDRLDFSYSMRTCPSSFCLRFMAYTWTNVRLGHVYTKGGDGSQSIKVSLDLVPLALDPC
jgi:hypothetical protein